MHDHYEIRHWQQLTARTVNELATYRYGVFVQHLKWPLECDHRHRQELDEFDLTGDTRYVLRRNRQHVLTGCARLMPADGLEPVAVSYESAPRAVLRQDEASVRTA